MVTASRVRSDARIVVTALSSPTFLKRRRAHSLEKIETPLVWFLRRATVTVTESILPAHRYLDDLGIPYEKRSFPPTTEKGGANVAAALGCREGQMVKTLIFETDTGERVLVMVAANRSAVSALLKKAIGSRNIRMAPFEMVKETTGYEVGSIPPFHWQPDGFRSFMDETLTTEEILGVGAGQWGKEIMITPENLLRACKGTLVNLTRRPD